jgi:rubredoxin
MEGEAYLKGNGYYFRDWEDSLKNGLEETNYKHITGDTHKMANYDQLKEEITAKVVAALTEKLKGDQHEIASAAPPEDEITGADFKALQKKKSVEEVNEEEEIEERKKRNTPRDSNRREPEKLKMNEEREKSLKDAMIAAARTSEEKKKRLQREMEKELDRQNIPQMSDADRAMALYYWSQQEDGPPLEEGEEEQLEENHCGGKRHDDLEPGMRCPMCGHVVMAEAEELEEISSDYGPDGYDPGTHGGHSGRSMTNAEREAAYQRAMKKIKADQAAAEEARRKAKEQADLEKRVGSAMGGMGYGLEEAQEKEVVEETISNDEWYQNELFESLKKRWTK